MCLRAFRMYKSVHACNSSHVDVRWCSWVFPAEGRRARCSWTHSAHLPWVKWKVEVSNTARAAPEQQKALILKEWMKVGRWEGWTRQEEAREEKTMVIDTTMLSFIPVISETFIWSLVSISSCLLALAWVREPSFSSYQVWWWRGNFSNMILTMRTGEMGGKKEKYIVCFCTCTQNDAGPFLIVYTHAQHAQKQTGKGPTSTTFPLTEWVANGK